MLCACRSVPKPILQTRESVRIEKVKDTLSLNALLECDSLNNVLLKSLDIAHTPNIRPTVNLKDNRLTIDAVNIRDSIRIIERDSIIYTSSSPPSTEKNRPRFFVLLSIAAAICLVYYLYKKKPS